MDEEYENLYYITFMKSIGEIQSEGNPCLNDVVVVCGKGNSRKEYRISAVVLATISPVFKVIRLSKVGVSLCMVKKQF